MTLTLSPAWDITYRVTDLMGEGLHRAISHSGKAGGKGVNVSRAIVRAGGECVTAAYLCGGTGQRIAAALQEEGISVYGISGEGDTRTNISVIAQDGKSMEINAPGTAMDEAGLCAVEKMLMTAECGDVVCLCGSLPAGCEKNVYAKFCGILRGRGALPILDCDGEALRLALTGENVPALIKPNREELAKLAGCEIGTAEDIPEIAARVCRLSQTAVLCTLGGDGAVYIDDKQVIRIPAAKIDAVRGEKGAGDTFLGTFLWRRYGEHMDLRASMMEAAMAAARIVMGI